LPSSLPLPTGMRTKLFRAMVAVLQGDPLVSSVVNEWFVWSGKPTDGGDLPFVPVSKVNVRLTPRMNGLSWWTPDSMIGQLSVLVETTIPNTNIDDVLNFQEAIENAFYPQNPVDASAMRRRFQQIGGENNGATVGLVMFAQPIYDDTLPERTDANFYALGELRIECRNLRARTSG